MTEKWRWGMDVGVVFLKFFMYSNRRRVKAVIVSFACSPAEQMYIRSCSKKAGKSLSAYVRQGAIQGYTHKDKSLPPKVLAFQGMLAQACGLLEVIARKRLDGDDLNALDRAQLNEVRRSLQEFLEHTKQHLS
jgi:hypothetical protein